MNSGRSWPGSSRFLLLFEKGLNRHIFGDIRKSDTDTVLVKEYVALLAGLSPENRTAIISRLEVLPSQEVSKEKTHFQKVFGAFESEENTEELIKVIRESRVSNVNLV